jgi:hypothetical protein
MASPKARPFRDRSAKTGTQPLCDAKKIASKYLGVLG